MHVQRDSTSYVVEDVELKQHDFFANHIGTIFKLENIKCWLGCGKTGLLIHYC